MNIEKERVTILVENEILIEQGNKVLQSVKQIEFLLGRIKQIGNRIRMDWKGEAGELCYQRIYEMIQQTTQAGNQMEEYVQVMKGLVKKEEPFR